MKHRIDLDLETLADLPVPRDLRISPDGNHVVYSLRPFTHKTEKPTSALWIADIWSPNSARQLTSGLFNDEQPKWSPDSTTIAFKSDRANAGKSSAIYIIPLSGGEAFPVTPIEHERFIAKFEWNSNGSYIAFTSADEKTDEQARKEKEKDDAKVWGEDWKFQRLRQVHVATKTIETIVSDDSHVYDFSWRPDGHQLVYVDHDTPDINSAVIYGTEIKTFDVIRGASEEIVHFPGAIWSIEWGSHGIYFIAGVVPKWNSTSNTLYKLSLEHRTWSRFGGFGDFNCCVRLQKHIAHLTVGVHHRLDDVFYSVHENGTTELYRAMQGTSAFDISVERGKPQIAFIKSNTSAPDEVFAVAMNSKDLVRLSNHNSRITSLHISKVHPIQASAEDNYDLDGVLFLPAKYERDEGPLPTVLWVHGGPYDRVTDSFSIYLHLEVPLLLSAGYAVICPNYRGGRGRGQEHAAYARGGVGTYEYSDCIAILEEGIQQGFVDQDHVVIGGWSQGGFISYLAMTQSLFQFRGAICGAGVVDWDTMTMTSDAYWFERDLAGGAPWDVDVKDGQPRKKGEDFGETLPEGSKKWIQETAGRHASALWHMRRVTPQTPVLILHGENDVRVPFSQAVAFHRACIHNNVPVKMVSYPREDHIFTERAHIIDLWKRILQFVDLHLR